jgi:hypothetical protein
MRLVVLAAVAAASLGFALTSGASAMPANGAAIGQAAPAAALAQPVWWRYRYRWHYHYRYWWRR